MNFFVPMTPATTGPQWIPIRKRTPRREAASIASIAADQVERQVGDALGVIDRLVQQAADDHVGVADRLDLLESMTLDQVVEDGEHLIEDRYQLLR